MNIQSKTYNIFFRLDFSENRVYREALITNQDINNYEAAEQRNGLQKQNMN